MLLLGIYITIFLSIYFSYTFIHKKITKESNKHLASSFGDESAIKPNRAASVLSVISLIFIWAAFTGSKISPIHLPDAFTGDTSFTYTAKNVDNQISTASVFVRVKKSTEKLEKPKNIEDNSNTFAKNDALKVRAWRSALARVKRNDIGGKDKQYKIIKINNTNILPGETVAVKDGTVKLTSKGSLSFTPNKGYQMEAIWLPPPEDVISRFIEISMNGYQNIGLFENIGWSLLRVISGFLLGCIVGIPLGYAMGLNGWVRGWFDPIIEFMRPIPPLALIPLIIIWFGIWETGKISLLFLAALWIMTIAARAGVSGINITKIHAAYSLGASKKQVLMHIIVPNSLPEIFTGARVAMGVCWGTVVAAELVAAEKGAGKMIISASKFQQTDVVIMGIILIGIIGYMIDFLMRKTENYLVPWKGKS